MRKVEIETILADIFVREESKLDPPTKEDWDNLSNKFHCKFNDDFKFFIELMAEYSFPGDIFNVSSGRTNGNDPIDLVYDSEMQAGGWNVDMIPFYGIGNGDYFCLSAKEGVNSAVYYFYHDDFRVEHYVGSFAEWIQQLPEFLA